MLQNREERVSNPCIRQEANALGGMQCGWGTGCTERKCGVDEESYQMMGKEDRVKREQETAGDVRWGWGRSC